MYFNILVSFGFELSATREISIHREDLKKVSEIFSTVLLIKVALASMTHLMIEKCVNKAKAVFKASITCLHLKPKPCSVYHPHKLLCKPQK